MGQRQHGLARGREPRALRVITLELLAARVVLVALQLDDEAHLGPVRVDG
jgi:hypothetical protein